MLFYGFSVQGKSHRERGTVCQDYNKVDKLNSKWYLGIVADGVGSALHADIGSKVAAESLTSFCKKNMKSQSSKTELEELLRQGYEYALEQVRQYASKQNDALPDYDTTMSAVLYDGESVIYGHAGDGGILVRFNDGSTKPITNRQKGADGTSVRPLRAGSQSWEFGICDAGAAGVLLVTDGMLDGVFQPVLINLPPDMMALARGDFAKDNAYITATEFFMNPNTVFQNKKVANANQFLKKYVEGDLGRKDAEEFLGCMMTGYRKMFDRTKTEELCRKISRYHYTLAALKKVTDDKSVVCLINEKAKISPQDATYYYEPDWEQQKNDYQCILYGKTMDKRTEQKTDKPLETLPQKVRDKETVVPKNNPEEIKVEYETKRRFPIRSFKIVTLASLAAIVLIAGIVGVAVFKGGSESGKEMKEKKGHFPKSTASPTPNKNYTEEEPNTQEDDRQRWDNNGYSSYSQYYEDSAQEFVNMLKKEVPNPDEVPEEMGEKMKDLQGILEKNGLKQQLEEFLEQHDSSGQYRQETVNRKKKVETKDINDLLNYIILINTQGEREQFMDNLEKEYDELNREERKTLRDNLQNILKEFERRTS